jgi:hypothetical protein
MRRFFYAFLASVAFFMVGCSAPNAALIVEKQASARIAASKWQAKADIEKWKAVQELAKSNSDVGRAMAGSAVQADAIKSAATGGGGQGNGGGYYMPPDPLEQAVSISREARGWLGVKFGRDVALDNNRTQREMRASDNATYLEFGREIGSTGRYGIDSTGTLGSEAIGKIPNYPAPAGQ